MEITAAGKSDIEVWLRLRSELWPKQSERDHRKDIARILSDPRRYGAFVARDGLRPAGFCKVSLRHDYVNGCSTSPVGFLEGIYTHPSFRKRGVARDLVAKMETWAREHDCNELASDALVDNISSHHMHAALGFEETERVVGFRKVLGAANNQ